MCLACLANVWPQRIRSGALGVRFAAVPSSSDFYGFKPRPALLLPPRQTTRGAAWGVLWGLGRVLSSRVVSEHTIVAPNQERYPEVVPSMSTHFLGHSKGECSAVGCLVAYCFCSLFWNTLHVKGPALIIFFFLSSMSLVGCRLNPRHSWRTQTTHEVCYPRDVLGASCIGNGFFAVPFSWRRSSVVQTQASEAQKDGLFIPCVQASQRMSSRGHGCAFRFRL